MAKIIERHHYDNADDFLTAIRPDSAWWWEHSKSRHVCPWIFRGQFNADWPLLPTAWRQDSPLMKLAQQKVLESEKTGGNKKTLRRAIADAEWECLGQFAKIANRMGFAMPQLLSSGNLKWLLEGVAPVAQHHGVPTRLLDWSECPMSAAYFATAADWRPNPQLNQRLAVFAIRRPNAKKFGFEIPWEDGKTRKYKIFKRTPSQVFTPYLIPQRSLFTCCLPGYQDREAQYQDTPAEEKGLDELLEIATSPNETPMLRVLTVSTEHADEIELRLNRCGISRLSLMPSHDNLGKETLLRLYDGN